MGSKGRVKGGVRGGGGGRVNSTIGCMLVLKINARVLVQATST